MGLIARRTSRSGCQIDLSSTPDLARSACWLEVPPSCRMDTSASLLLLCLRTATAEAEALWGMSLKQCVPGPRTAAPTNTHGVAPALLLLLLLSGRAAANEERQLTHELGVWPALLLLLLIRRAVLKPITAYWAPDAPAPSGWSCCDTAIRLLDLHRTAARSSKPATHFPRPSSP